MTFYNQPPEPPLHVFPQEIRQLLRQAATAFKHAPVEVPLVGFLSLLSGCIGCSRTVEVKGSWQESGNLYLVLVGDSGIGKSHCFKVMLKPVWDEDLRQKQAWENDLAAYLAEMETRAKEKSEVSGLPIKPVRKQYIVEDSTIEAIGKISSENPRGLIWMADELAGLLGNLDPIQAVRTIPRSKPAFYRPMTPCPGRPAAETARKTRPARPRHCPSPAPLSLKY